MNDLYPFLAVRDTAAAARFYAAAFGATEVQQLGDVYVLEVAGRLLGLAPENRDTGTLSPETLGATTVRISLHVGDADAVAARAVRAGAQMMFPVEDQPYGLRQGRVVDPFGHHWLIASELKEAS